VGGARLLTAVLVVGAGLRSPIPHTAAAALAAGQLQPGAVKALARGRILVAGRDLGDPNFAESVVFLAEYSAQGAMGLILNRKSDVPLSQLLPDLPKAPAAPPVVFLGGPVQSAGVLALLQSDAPRKDTTRIIGDVYEVGTPALLGELIAAGTAPDRLRVYFGYAGWAPGQLENETRAGAWLVLDGGAAIVFDTDPESLWRRLIPRADDRMASSAGSPRDSYSARTPRYYSWR
jgi:putative transcriptional regulator